MSISCDRRRSRPIESDESELTIVQVYDLVGLNVTALVGVTDRTATSVTLDMSNLPKGLYIVKTPNTTNKVSLE